MSLNSITSLEEANLRILYAESDVQSAIIASILGAICLPLAVVFVLFSTARGRRRWLFWIQCLSLICAMVGAATEIASYSIDASRAFDAGATFIWLQFVKEIFKWLVPLLADVALICRLWVFYPRSLYSNTHRLAIVAFPILIKIPRLACIITNLVYMGIALEEGEETWPDGFRYQLAEIALEMIDNAYTVTLLLRESLHFKQSTSNTYTLRSNRTQRMARFIVQSVLMTYVPAFLLQVVLLIISAIAVARDSVENLNLAVTIVFNVHVYVNVVMSLLATSWSSICNTHIARKIESASNNGMKSPPPSPSSPRKASPWSNAGAMEAKHDTPPHVNGTMDAWLSDDLSDSYRSKKGIAEDQNYRSHHSRSGSQTLSDGKATMVSPDEQNLHTVHAFPEEGTQTRLAACGCGPASEPEDQTLLYQLTRCDL